MFRALVCVMALASAATFALVHSTASAERGGRRTRLTRQVAKNHERLAVLKASERGVKPKAAPRGRLGRTKTLGSLVRTVSHELQQVDKLNGNLPHGSGVRTRGEKTDRPHLPLIELGPDSWLALSPKGEWKRLHREVNEGREVWLAVPVQTAHLTHVPLAEVQAALQRSRDVLHGTNGDVVEIIFAKSHGSP